MWDRESEKTLQRCWHCGEEIVKTQRLCQFCNLKEKRIEMHVENKRIFGELWECKPCKAILSKNQ